MSERHHGVPERDVNEEAEDLGPSLGSAAENPGKLVLAFPRLLVNLALRSFSSGLRQCEVGRKSMALSHCKRNVRFFLFFFFFFFFFLFFFFFFFAVRQGG